MVHDLLPTLGKIPHDWPLSGFADLAEEEIGVILEESDKVETQLVRIHLTVIGRLENADGDCQFEGKRVVGFENEEGGRDGGDETSDEGEYC